MASVHGHEPWPVPHGQGLGQLDCPRAWGIDCLSVLLYVLTYCFKHIIILAAAKTMDIPASLMEPVEKAFKVRAKEVRDMGNRYSAKDSIRDALKESIFIRRKGWHVGVTIHP